MAPAKIKQLASGFTPIVILSVGLLVSLYLMSGATEGSAEFGRLFSWLLIVNMLGAVILVTLIGANLYRLVRNYRRKEIGSRLTARFLIAFVITAMVPVSILFYFSIGFLHQGIDSWFDVEVEQALNDALDLSQAALDERMRALQRQMGEVVNELEGEEGSSAALLLNDFRFNSGASEMTLFSSASIIAFSNEDQTAMIPNRPNESVMSSVQVNGNYVGLDTIEGKGLSIRVVLPVSSSAALSESQYLQALFPVPENSTSLAENVHHGITQYNKLVYLRTPLKYSFTLTLSLVLLLTLLTSVWAAFTSARRMAEPVRDLAEGTRAVAAGDYSKRLPSPVASDELGFLVNSFNEMTSQIEAAQQALKRSQVEAETQHAYLQTLLGHMSSGVLSVDERLVLRTVNRRASEILGVNIDGHIGQPLSAIKEMEGLTDFIGALEPQLTGDVSEWHEEVTLFGPGGRKVFMCRGAELPVTENQESGHVVVFDDITQLIQAERDAAWGEVARRLAHEIKNPLTPIKLSAERLHHKYYKELSSESAQGLERYTHTIVQQVEQMKEMVNAFSDYARAPQMNRAPMEMNSLVNEVLDLYRDDEKAVQIEARLDKSLPGIEADRNQLRQVLHNLLKNACEAVEDRQDARIIIESRCDVLADCRYIELRVDDNGPGIPHDIMISMFEPYVTTKTRGTGLGLAIVKKIIEEHGGMLLAENLKEGGARFALRLPVEEHRA